MRFENFPNKNYLAIRKFSDPPPQLSYLATGFTLERSDIKQ